jgi:hypothetical protein
MDLSTYWVFFQQQKSKAGFLVILLIFFAGGWQLGKISSPYYGAHPIVFEDTTCEVSGGAVEELVELKDEGVAQREKSETAKKNIDSPSVSKKPVVAGVTKKADSLGGKFVGSVNSNLFHDPSCSSSKRIKESNQVWFDSIETAEKSGYSPSQCTRKLLGI